MPLFVPRRGGARAANCSASIPTPQYRVPIVAGEGLGGAIASRIVAQSPLQTVGGGVAVDPAAALPIGLRNLHASARRPTTAKGSGTIDAPVLKNPWIVALVARCFRGDARPFRPRSPAQTKLMQTARTAGPGDDARRSPISSGRFSRPRQPRTVDGLPLVEMPATPHTRRMAIFISGDGGWRDVDKRVSEKLQQLGVSVVGWDSLRYFWRRKTPDQAAADLAAVIEAYQRKWGCDQIALIGFSFGADVMPFIYDRLDENLRGRIVLISLLSPGQAADWEIRVAGWFGAGPSSEATPLAPAIAEMPGERVQCFYGDADRGNSCGLLGARGAQVIEKRGDHHMDGDYDLIGRQIFEAFQQRLSAQR